MTRPARPQHVVVHNRKVTEIVEAVGEKKSDWQKRQAQKRGNRQHKTHPKLIRGLDHLEVPETIGSRIMHTLFPRREAKRLLRHSLANQE